jgi:hypothetical protein
MGKKPKSQINYTRGAHKDPEMRWRISGVGGTSSWTQKMRRGLRKWKKETTDFVRKCFNFLVKFVVYSPLDSPRFLGP